MAQLKVARYDYPAQFGDDFPELLQELGAMMLEGRHVLSPEVARFEAEFAEFLGSDFACGVNSGTDALVLALRALGIGAGDEVIVQANTFHATVAAICHAGATPVLVDVDPNSFLLAEDGQSVEQAITDRTRAIMVVHLFGKTTPMDALLALAGKHSLTIIEDAAQAHGAAFKGQRAGTFGDVGCFSFHPSKNLGAVGDGGILCSSNAELVGQVQVLRNLGQDTQNHHVEIGLNSKLDGLQARVLSHKLQFLAGWNESRQASARKLRNGLAHLNLGFQQWDEAQEDHVFHLFQLRCSKRDELVDYLQGRGIDATVRYPTPIHLQPAFAKFGWQPGQFRVSEALGGELLCLPLRPNMPDREIDYMVEHVSRFVRCAK